MLSPRFGPFTSRQLTTIIVAGMITLGIPTGAYAVTTIAHTVIVDSGTAHTPAKVTPTGNLQVAEAAPSAFFQNASTNLTTSYTPVATPPSGLALVITTVHIAIFADPSPGLSTGVTLRVTSTATCAGSFVGAYAQEVAAEGVGQNDIPLGPGLGIPAGDALCAAESGSLAVQVSVSGYTVPAGSV